MATIVKRPSGKWQATVRSGGKSLSKSFSKRADATSWSRSTELQTERMGLHATLQTSSDTCTVGDALARFSVEVSANRQATSGDVERIRLASLGRNKLARIRLDKLTSVDVVTWRDRRLKQVKPSTVVREMTLLQSAIEHALDGRVTENVVRQVKRPRVNDRRERRLLVGEWERLLDAIIDANTPLLRPLLIFAIETAMRRGELLSMQWKHVDLDRCTVFLPTTKNGHARTVPLSPTAVDVLRSLPRTDDRVFPLGIAAVRLGFERLRNRAGIDDLRLHDLRHEAISRLVERGLSLFEVQQVSGHRTLQMLQRYVHLQTADIVKKLHQVA